MTRFPTLDTNPFQGPVVNQTRSKRKTARITTTKNWLWVPFLLIVGVVTYYFLSPYSPVKLPTDPRLFIGGAGLSQANARQKYAQSYQELQKGDPKVALVGFKDLEKYYPGLRELILLHQAEAKAKLGEEAGSQALFSRLVKDYPDSPLGPRARYELGQSYMRASMNKEANATFDRLKSDLPDKDYGIASLYYLGLLADSKGKLAFWKDYLQRCPDCTFSGDIATRLEPVLNKPLTSLDHQLLGLAYASTENDWDKAVAHLSQASTAVVWYELGMAYNKTGKYPQAKATWIAGLSLKPDDLEKVNNAIDGLVRLPGIPAMDSLKQLQALNLPIGGDYVLWRLSQLDTANQTSYWQSILANYPDGLYAPESSWRLLWPLVNTNAAAYVEKARAHIDKYPYAKSTPTVLFWMAKLAEKSDKASANTLYQQLAANYPDNYYAFRAQSRLAVLNGKSDPGWATSAKTAYPPKNFDFKTLAILPTETDFTQVYPNTGSRAFHIAQELVAIGAADDLDLVIRESLGKLTPATESWINHLWGNRPKALRSIRDGLQEEAKTLKRPVIPTDDELKLLYPIYFDGPIATEAPRHGIDPFLAQALMREESYFNEKAISSSNAFGLMQLLPATAGDVAKWEGMGGFQANQLFLPAVNIRLGTRYLEYLHTTFNGNSMPSVGAYNGGPNAMKRWVGASSVFSSDPDLFIEQIPYDQTRDYIKKVFGSYWNYKRLYTASSP